MSSTIKERLGKRLAWWNQQWHRPAQWVGRIDPRLSQIADAERDALAGTRLARWLPTLIALVAVTFSFARLGINFVYTESVPFLLLAIAVGDIATSFGIFFFACHLTLDLLRSYDSSTFGRLVADVLLWLLVVEIPLAGHEAGNFVRARWQDAKRKRWLELAVGAATVGLLTAMWCQMSAMLIWPVFTWSHQNTTVEAMKPLQGYTVWIAGASAALYVAMFFVGPRARMPALTAAPAGGWAPKSSTARTLLRFALLLMLMSGLIRGWIDLAILLAALLLAHRLGVARLSVRVRATMARLPYALRFLVGYGVTFVVGWAIIRSWYPGGMAERLLQDLQSSPNQLVQKLAHDSDPYLPVVLTVAIGFVLFDILLRAPSEAEKKAAPPAALLLFLACVWPATARADNCNPENLKDCHDTAAGAAAAAAGAAGAAGGISSWINRRKPPQ